MIPQPAPLWCAENSGADTWGGRIIGWLPTRAGHQVALVARVDADGATRATYERPLGAVEVWLADTRHEAFAAAAAARTAVGSTEQELLDAAMHTMWLEGRWEWATRKMGAAEREAAAAAVIRHSTRMDPDDPVDSSSVRWWAA